MKVAYFLAPPVTLASGIVLLGLLGFRFNLSPSLPVGVYRVTPEPPVPGSVVHACLPHDVAEFARARGYLGPGACAGNTRPIGKVVLAAAGDVVTVSREALQVNAVPVPDSRTASEDSRGRPLPHHGWGEHRLGPDELWLFSLSHQNAYDSRYFGPVRMSDVISVLQPVGRR